MLEQGFLNWPWYSLDWLRPDVLRSFRWEVNYALYLLPVAPLFFVLRLLVFYRFRSRIDIAFRSPEAMRSLSSILRFIPPALFCMSLLFFILALARPQRTDEMSEQHSEGIDIILAVDISASMNETDLYPNRLEAVKRVARKFIKGRTHDRIGIVVFAGEAYSLCPLTNDIDLLNEYTEEIDFKMIQAEGTALGTALGVATNRMRESKAKSKVIILLSDGANTTGNIDPLTAAGLAAAFGIKIYTVIAGRNNPQDPYNPASAATVSPDETTLRDIAKTGEGLFFRAESNETLTSVFAAIDRYEKAEITETRFRETHDYYTVYLCWGLLMFVLFMASKNTFMSNGLED